MSNNANVEEGGKWGVFTRLQKDEAHIIPLNDLKEHVFEVTCWCHPEEDDESPYRRLFVHKSADGREDFESGARKVS